MKNLTYVSVDNFLDVDFPIVKELNKRYKLKWIVYYQTHSPRTFTKDEVNQFVTLHSIDLEFVDIGCRFSHPKSAVIAWQTVAKIRRTRPDIIYFQTFNDPYLPFFVYFLLPRRKVVVATHDVILHKNFSSMTGVLFHNLVLSIFKNYQLFSKTQLVIFREKHPRKNSFVAKLYLKDFGRPHGIFKQEVGLVNFLFFGTVRDNKGLEYLIEAGNLLAAEFHNFKIIVAGKAANPQYYKDLIKYPERFDLQFRLVPNEEIADYFSITDFLVLPYKDVTQSGPLLIAYNYNVPVIASDFPGFREYVEHGQNGFLFEPCNAKDLATVMRGILERPDEQLSKTRNELANFVHKEINLENIIQDYVDFFDDKIK